MNILLEKNSGDESRETVVSPSASIREERFAEEDCQRAFAEAIGITRSKSLGEQNATIEATVRHYMRQEKSSDNYGGLTRTNSRRTHNTEENNTSMFKQLSWEEAKKIPEIMMAEKCHAARHLDIPYTKEENGPKLGKAFRWCCRLCEGDVYFTEIHGDVGAVFPGLTNDDVRRDSGCFSKYYSAETLERVGAYLQDMLSGKVQKGCTYTWPCRPEYDLVIEIELLDIFWYLDPNNKPCVLQCCETRHVTEAFARYGDIVAKIICEHRETADHRLGNKLRLMHLLCQEGRLQELDQAFIRIGHEVAIRRHFTDNLPPIQPIKASLFIAEEFTVIDTKILIFYQDDNIADTDRQHIDAEAHNNKSKHLLHPDSIGLLFFNKNGEPLSPIILQVLVLQDLASNCFKHGTGTATIKITQQCLTVSNEIDLLHSSHASSRHVGLECLQRVASDLGISISFMSKDNIFSIYINLNIQFIDLLTPSDSYLPVAAQEAATLPSVQTDPCSSDLQIHDLTWIIVDDEPLICKRFANVAKKAFKIDMLIASNPVEIRNLVDLITWCTKYKANRATVVIFDENLREMNPNSAKLLAVCGTELRNRVYSSAFLKSKAQSNPPTLFSVSASASVVSDPRLLLTLGKAGSVIDDMNKILNTIKPILINTLDCNPPDSPLTAAP